MSEPPTTPPEPEVDPEVEPPVEEPPPVEPAPSPTRPHWPSFVAGIVLILVLGGGALIARDLLGSNASVKIAYTEQFGKKQAVLHTLGSPVAPFLGPYHQGQCGPGIRLMEGALRNLPKPVRHVKAANCFGPATKKQVITFQKRLHYNPTGVYNLPTHKQLVARGGYSKTAKAGLRYIRDQRVKQRHVLLVQHERRTVQIVAAHVAKVGGSTLAYTQGSSRSYFPPWPGIPPNTDCSGMATYILYQSGAGATVGYYGPGSPVGWTGTMRFQGQHLYNINRTNLQPGDLVFYGRSPNWSHVATYIGSGLVVSHGGVGVNVEPYTYRPVGEIRRYIF